MSLACVLLLSAPAFAERSIAVELADAVPFAAAELVAAMRVRLPTDGQPVHVRVDAATDDGVRIAARGSTRDVKLGALRGEAAARLVALTANDLLLEDLAVTPRLVHRPRTRFAMLGSAAAWDGTLGGLAFDVSIPRGGWVLAVEAGGSKLFAGPLALSAAVVRASAGVRLGVLELRAGPTLVPLFVEDGTRDQTVLAGGGASARVRLSIGGGLGAVFAGGVDAFATRTTYIVDGMTALVTPRFAPWLAAGIEVTP